MVAILEVEGPGVIETIETVEVETEVEGETEVTPLGGKLTVEEYDPLHTIVRWRNNKLPDGKKVHVVTLFLVYHQGKWWPVGFKSQTGRRYLWGSIKENEPAPKKGRTKHSNTKSYAVPVCQWLKKDKVRCGVRVIIAEPRGVGKAYYDGVKKRRVVGLLYEDVKKLKTIARRDFYDLFEVKRWVPPAYIEMVQVKKE